jgi:hypothetical protein
MAQAEVRREKIEVALEALSAAFASKFVFAHIRGPFASSNEWADMPERVGDTNDKRMSRGAYFAPLKRIEQNKEFFERLWKIQPLAMAVFGPDVEAIFLKAHEARRDIEVAAQMLMENVGDPHRGDDEATIELYKQLRVDIYGHGGKYTKEGDRVGAKLDEYRAGTEATFGPIVDREYREVKEPQPNLASS